LRIKICSCGIKGQKFYTHFGNRVVPSIIIRLEYSSWNKIKKNPSARCLKVQSSVSAKEKARNVSDFKAFNQAEKSCNNWLWRVILIRIQVRGIKALASAPTTF
jgi:hypothetical protein